jgi:adenylate cyclase
LSDSEDLARENRTLTRRLERSHRKLRMLEGLQEQNANVMRALMSDLEKEQARSESLLLNILPESIAQRLKTEHGAIADSHDSASVMFIDIVGFTPLSEALTADEMVEWLNEVYSNFDALVQDYGAEKIHTMGDGYMVATGVPEEREDHAAVITRLALELRDYFADLAPVAGHKAGLRIGINSGSVVGGVIGTHKVQYDVWGDAVNTAARMESHGVAGKIQITEATHDLLGDMFVCESRGPIEVKGKGEMSTWFVLGRK